jgi:hypothetical protein
MNDVNYSSARIAELSERDSWMVMQCWFIHSFCKRVYEEWLAGALLGGWITFPNGGKSMPADKYQKFVEAASFQGRRWSWIDPMKEVGAAIEAVGPGSERATARITSMESDAMTFKRITATLDGAAPALDARAFPVLGAAPPPPAPEPVVPVAASRAPARSMLAPTQTLRPSSAAALPRPAAVCGGAGGG